MFGPQPARLGPGQVWVPEAMFKLVYDAVSHRAWAHWLPNSADAQVRPPISYETLTRRIGLRLLPGPPQD